MPESVPSLLAELEAEQARLRELLTDREPSKLAQRPPNGTWSVLENVQHLLFAEQLHLSGFLPEGPDWSPLGRPPDGLLGRKPFAAAGSVTTSDVGEVLLAWREAHAAIRPFIRQDDPAQQTRLQRHLRHLRNHIKVIERLLRAQDKALRPAATRRP